MRKLISDSVVYALCVRRDGKTLWYVNHNGLIFWTTDSDVRSTYKKIDDAKWFRKVSQKLQNKPICYSMSLTQKEMKDIKIVKIRKLRYELN